MSDITMWAITDQVMSDIIICRPERNAHCSDIWQCVQFILDQWAICHLGQAGRQCNFHSSNKTFMYVKGQQCDRKFFKVTAFNDPRDHNAVNITVNSDNWVSLVSLRRQRYWENSDMMVCHSIITRSPSQYKAGPFSYLYNGNAYTGKTPSLYEDCPQSSQHQSDTLGDYLCFTDIQQ